MSGRPNILFLMTDQMQGRVLEPGHPCLTPNFDRLVARGMRFPRGYTPNPVCSPARASLMTGLLPHSHGVITVTHCVSDDQSCLRLDKPHWAQGLAEAGYRTGYFGKWHVERSNDLQAFGWQTHSREAFQQRQQELVGPNPPPAQFSLQHHIKTPGYRDGLLYGVRDVPPEKRGMGVACSLAGDFLDEALAGDDPWCCFVSVTEPHDPYVCGEDAFAQYDVDALELPPNAADDMADRPNLYRKVAALFGDLTDRQKKEAMACYFATITEIDQQFGRLLDQLEASGQQDRTIVVLTADHGDFIGAHGLYMKNVGAFEEAYQVPMVIAGPDVEGGVVSQARLGLQDLCPTLLELAGLAPVGAPDSRSYAPVLRDHAGCEDKFLTGYAEFEGTRIQFTQRLIWNGPWKYVWNGFDYDELYNLDEDPYEMNNLAADPRYTQQVRDLMKQAWEVVRDTNDHSLYNSHYPCLRVAPFGPNILEESAE